MPRGLIRSGGTSEGSSRDNQPDPGPSPTWLRYQELRPFGGRASTVGLPGCLLPGYRTRIFVFTLLVLAAFCTAHDRFTVPPSSPRSGHVQPGFLGLSCLLAFVPEADSIPPA